MTSSAELARMIEGLAEAVPVGSRWRHVRSGTVYVVMGHCLNEASLAPHVLYGSFERPGMARVWWSRPASEFLDGRFEPIRGTVAPAAVA